MIETLINWDKELFRWVHCTLANNVFDWLMPILREAKTWIPLYLLFAFLAIKNYKIKGLYIALATALIVVLCDRFSAGLMKPFFERLRPCHEPSLAAHIRHVIDCGGQYGFISSHATNHFGLAVMFTWFFKKIATKDIAFANCIFYVWAGLISFAQVYVGKHYVGDVLIGAICGLLIGKIILTIFTKMSVIKNLSKAN